MTSFEFLLATRVSRSTVNLFRVHLMAICNRKPPEYHGKHLQIQTKTTLWHIVWVSSRLSKFGVIRCKIEGGVSIWSHFGHQFFPSANHRAGSYQTWAPREGWHHNENLQRVSRPQVVLFVSYGDFNANLRVVRKDTKPLRKDLPFDVGHRRSTPNRMRPITRKLFWKTCAWVVEN